MKSFISCLSRTVSFSVLAMVCSLQFAAVGALISVNPGNGATGVGTSSSVVFTFDMGMDDTMTQAMFLADNGGPFPVAVPVSMAWNGSYTVLTCSPGSGWPNSATITWFVEGETLDFEEVSAMGTFHVGTGGGGGHTGTNSITSFVIGKMHWYLQETAAPPVLDVNEPYGFQAIASLASNRTANAIEIMPATFQTYDLFNYPLGSESWMYLDWEEASLEAFENKYPAGNFAFILTSSSGSVNFSYSMPPEMAQPNAPRILNFDAAQAIDPTQPFTLTWEPFQGGTANDHISVSIGTNFSSPEFIEANALKGTATSVTIPAGTLKAGEHYSATIMFIRQQLEKDEVLSSSVNRATITEFPVATKVSAPVISGISIQGGKFTFDISAAPGQTIVVESSTNPSFSSPTTVLTTTATGDKVHFVDQQPTTSARFFRVR